MTTLSDTYSIIPSISTSIGSLPSKSLTSTCFNCDTLTSPRIIWYIPGTIIISQPVCLHISRILFFSSPDADGIARRIWLMEYLCASASMSFVVPAMRTPFILLPILDSSSSTRHIIFFLRLGFAFISFISPAPAAPAPIIIALFACPRLFPKPLSSLAALAMNLTKKVIANKNPPESK